MQLFSSFLSLKICISSLSHTCIRFTFSVITSVILTTLLLFYVNTDSESPLLYKFIITSIPVFFLTTGLSLLFENFSYKFSRYFIFGVSIIYGILFFLSLEVYGEMSIYSFFYSSLHIIGFIGFLFIAPYIHEIFSERNTDVEYMNYFTRIFWVFLLSILVGVLLSIFGYIAITAVYELFDVEHTSTFYKNWAVISLSLIAPIYGLTILPKIPDIDKKRYEYNRFLSFLIRYIVVPFIFIYFLILYAYSIKVLLNFSDWPKGIISGLVIGFSIFGYIGYIFSRPYESDNRFIEIFRKYFPYAVIPQIAMLAYAIYLRTSQYDLTINRYFVIVFGLWLLFISLYVIISRSQGLPVIVGSLVILSLIISIGPWSFISLPITRQENRLIRNLETAKILQGNTIIPLSSYGDISEKLSSDIAGGIEYLCYFDDCARIKKIFPDQFRVAQEKSYKEWKKWNPDMIRSLNDHKPSHWEIQNTIMEEIKVRRYNPYNHHSIEPSFHYSIKGSLYPLDTRGYTTIVSVFDETNLTKIVDDNLSYPFITIDTRKKTILYKRSKEESYSYPFNLDPEIENGTSPRNLDKKDLTFEVSGSGKKIKIILQNMTIINPAYTGSIFPGIDTYGIGLIQE